MIADRLGGENAPEVAQLWPDCLLANPRGHLSRPDSQAVPGLKQSAMFCGHMIRLLQVGDTRA